MFDRVWVKDSFAQLAGRIRRREFLDSNGDNEEDLSFLSPRGSVTFDKTGRVLYMLDSRGRDTAALVAVDLASGEETEIVTKGRHDPCVGLRATPIAEAMVALVVMDHFLRHRAQNADVPNR